MFTENLIRKVIFYKIIFQTIKIASKFCFTCTNFLERIQSFCSIIFRKIYCKIFNVNFASFFFILSNKIKIAKSVHISFESNKLYSFQIIRGIIGCMYLFKSTKRYKRISDKRDFQLANLTATREIKRR